MSCCNGIDTDNPNNNQSCGTCNPCTQNTAECESLPSALDNFTTQFFGEVSKTVVNGRVQWTLPCELATGLPDNPRESGEGLACYFLRLFENGIVGLTGLKGDQGDAGADGIDGYTFTASEFQVPTSECPIAQFDVADPDVIPTGAYVFVAGAGWFSIASFTGSTLMCQLIQAIAPAGTSVPVDSLVVVTGPEGPQGSRGAKGDTGAKGDKGDTGSPGAAGNDGESARTETTANYTQPAVGVTVVLTVLDSSYFADGMQVFVNGGGYYRVVAVVPGALTLRNLGIAATNSAPTTIIPTGAAVTTAGVSPVASGTSNVVATGTADVTIDNSLDEVTFDTNALEIILPSAGTYRVSMSMTYLTGGTAPVYVRARLYNDTLGSGVGLLAYANTPTVNSYYTVQLDQLVTVASATTLTVHAATNANTIDAVSGQCSLSWIEVNPIS